MVAVRGERAIQYVNAMYAAHSEKYAYMAEEQKMLQVRIPPELLRAVREEAKKDRRSLASWMTVQLERLTQEEQKQAAGVKTTE